MQKSRVFPRIGLDIRRKCPQSRVYTRLFSKQSCMGLRSMFFKYSNGQNSNFMCRMVLEWRECEHGDVKEAVMADIMSQQVLRACGIYKFWCLGGLRAKPGLLQMLVDYWDPDSESFRIDGMTLNIEVEDIYSITGLSR